MMRLALLVLCLTSACSTMPPFLVEDYQAPALDAGLASDAATLPDAAPRDAALGFDATASDAGRLDAGRPDGGGDGSLDFDYECTLYGISPRCDPSNPRRPACSGASLGEVCFTLPGRGFAQMFECQSMPGGRGWVPTHQARCAYNCRVELPGASFFSLSVDSCGRRPLTACQLGESGTTQDAVDAVLDQVVLSCGLRDTSDTVSAGITIDDQGCPSWFHSTLPRVPPKQRECVTDALERLRFDCAPECSVVFSTVLR